MQLSQNLLYFQWSGTGVKYIDIARCMSAVNRKLHRQQGLWTIGGCKYQTDTPGAEIQLSHAPKVWPVRNALVMGFSHWKKQQARAYKGLGGSSLKPKWQDFKVYLEENHRTGTELLPSDGGPYGASSTVSTTGADWVHSKLVIMETDHANAGNDEMDLKEPLLHILGGDNGMTNVGLVYHYQLSRAQIDEDASGEPEHEAIAENSIFLRSSESIDETVEEIAQNLTDDNDQPPYDPDDMPGAGHFANPVVGAYVKTDASGAGLSVSMNGFSAPNGLIKVQASGDGTHHLQLYVVGREAY